MKLQIIETRETDGDWFKIRLNGEIIKWISISRFATREEALKRTDEMAMFIWENNGDEKVIKEMEVINQSK